MSTSIQEAYTMDRQMHVPKKKTKNTFPKPKEWIPNAIKFYKKKLFGAGWGGIAYQARARNRKIAKQVKN